MKRLVLYSDQILPETSSIDQRLLALLDKDRPRMGYIPSCADPERGYYQDRQVYYAQYGITLSPYFELDGDYAPDRLDNLLTAGAIHLSGGNTFYFLYWLKLRNLLEPLRQYVAQGGVLIGVSAGTILMTPDIRTAGFCGDTPVEGLTDTGGLGLVDFAFAPHFGSMEVSLSNLEAYSCRYQITVYGCPDGAGLVIENDQVERFGNIVIITNGQVIHS